MPLRSAVKFEAVVTCYDQLLVVSWHVGDFVNNKIKLAKTDSFSSHQHIIRLYHALIGPISYANREKFIIFTEGKRIGIPLIHFLLCLVSANFLFFSVVNIAQGHRISPFCRFDVELFLTFEDAFFNGIKNNIDMMALLRHKHPSFNSNGQKIPLVIESHCHYFF